jgi:hypothetical protein
VLAGSLSLMASESDRKRLEIETVQSTRFAPDGDILIRDSFGELFVEGWDRPEVEITVLKGTRRRYAAAEQDKALEYLNSIEVVAVVDGGDRLLVTTAFPDRNLSRPFRGKSNVELVYKIKAPRNCNLAIEHDTGIVNVKNITGNVNVTARFGEITMRVPETGNYNLNARTRIGEVDTDFPGQSARKFLTQTFQNNAGAATSQIHLRLGIGSINIRKTQVGARPSRRELRASFQTLPDAAVA